jgi:hypothetical protein
MALTSPDELTDLTTKQRQQDRKLCPRQRSCALPLTVSQFGA